MKSPLNKTGRKFSGPDKIKEILSTEVVSVNKDGTILEAGVPGGRALFRVSFKIEYRRPRTPNELIKLRKLENERKLAGRRPLGGLTTSQVTIHGQGEIITDGEKWWPIAHARVKGASPLTAIGYEDYIDETVNEYEFKLGKNDYKKIRSAIRRFVNADDETGMGTKA